MEGNLKDEPHLQPHCECLPTQSGSPCLHFTEFLPTETQKEGSSKNAHPMHSFMTRINVAPLEFFSRITDLRHHNTGTEKLHPCGALPEFPSWVKGDPNVWANLHDTNTSDVCREEVCGNKGLWFAWTSGELDSQGFPQNHDIFKMYNVSNLGKHWELKSKWKKNTA